MTRYAVVIVGLSGCEKYLAERHETTELRRADRFGSERAATEAATGYINTHPRVVARQMAFRIEPIQRGAQA